MLRTETHRHSQTGLASLPAWAPCLSRHSPGALHPACSSPGYTVRRASLINSEFPRLVLRSPSSGFPALPKRTHKGLRCGEAAGLSRAVLPAGRHWYPLMVSLSPPDWQRAEQGWRGGLGAEEAEHCPPFLQTSRNVQGETDSDFDLAVCPACL